MKDFLLKDNSGSPLLEVYEQLWFEDTWSDKLQWLVRPFHTWSKVSKAFLSFFCQDKGFGDKAWADLNQ